MKQAGRRVRWTLDFSYKEPRAPAKHPRLRKVADAYLEWGARRPVAGALVPVWLLYLVAITFGFHVNPVGIAVGLSSGLLLAGFTRRQRQDEAEKAARERKERVAFLAVTVLEDQDSPTGYGAHVVHDVEGLPYEDAAFLFEQLGEHYRKLSAQSKAQYS